jgi:hypothetical protein
MGKRPDHQLRGILEHLVYEVWMFAETARMLSTRGAIRDPADEERVIVNALLESFTIHTRSLLDFLYPPSRPKGDDVVAEDFFDDPKVWYRQRPAKSDLLKGVHKRVAKEIAHLTYARIGITPEAKRWPFVAITTDLLQVFQRFASLLPADLTRPKQT